MAPSKSMTPSKMKKCVAKETAKNKTRPKNKKVTPRVKCAAKINGNSRKQAPKKK